MPLKQAELFEAGCGDSKSCFRIPSKCDFNCKAMVSYEKEGLDMVFKLVGYSDGYIAVGLSPDNDQMGEDLTTACYLNQGKYVLIFVTTFYFLPNVTIFFNLIKFDLIFIITNLISL